MPAFAPVLSPQGALSLRHSNDATAWEPPQNTLLLRAFERGAGHGLLCLGADEVGTSLPVALAYWREFGVRHVTALCALPDVIEASTKPAVPSPDTEDLDRLAAAAPPITGAEYLTASVLAKLWQSLDAACDSCPDWGRSAPTIVRAARCRRGELLAGSGQEMAQSKPAPNARAVLNDGDVAALFGIEMATFPFPRRQSRIDFQG